MTVTLHWHHLILLLLVPVWIWGFWIFSDDGPDTYGIGAMFRFFVLTVGTLFVLCVYFALGYFGAF